MKSNKMKEIIDQDFDQTENYLKIVSKSERTQKNKVHKIILCGAVFALGIAMLQYLPSNKSSGSDPYFITKVYAEENEYDIDKEIVFNTKMAKLGDWAHYNEYGTDKAIHEQLEKGNIISEKHGYRINLKITGENIEKVTYRVISDNQTIDLQRGVSGELQYLDPYPTYPELYGWDAHDGAEKIASDLTNEEFQSLLELSGYGDLHAKDLSDKQKENLVNHSELDYDADIQYEAIKNGTWESIDFGRKNMFSTTWYDILKKPPLEVDKIYGPFHWDFIESGREITFSKEALNDRQVLYVAIVDSFDRYADADERNADFTDRRILKKLATDMKVEVDIVYEDGTVKTKTLTYEYKDLGISKYGFPEYELQGTLK